MGIRQRSSFVFWSWPSKESASTSKCWVGRMMEKEPWEALVSYHKRKLSERMLTINFLLWWVRNLCSALHKVGLTYNSIWFPFPCSVLSQISHTSKVKTKSFFLSILIILWTWFKKRKVNNHSIVYFPWSSDESLSIEILLLQRRGRTAGKGEQQQHLEL